MPFTTSRTLASTAGALVMILSLSGLAPGQGVPDAEVRRLIEELDPVLKRVRAARSLGKLGPRAARAVPSLIQTLTTATDSRLIVAAIDALGGIGAKSSPAIPRLRKLAAGLEPKAAQAARRALKAIEGPPTSLSPERVDPAHEGKRVTLAGVVEGQEVLYDNDFGVKTSGAHLRRIVERYQWVEVRSVVRSKRGREIVLKYVLRWHNQVSDSDTFKVKEGHENPSADWADSLPARYLVTRPQIGLFELRGFESSRAPVALDLAADTKSVYLGDPGQLWVPMGDAFYATPANPKNPKLGDQRVRFETSSPARVIVRGVQLGSVIHLR